MRFVRFEARGHEAQNVGRMSSGWDQVFLPVSPAGGRRAAGSFGSQWFFDVVWAICRGTPTEIPKKCPSVSGCDG